MIESRQPVKGEETGRAFDQQGRLPLCRAPLPGGAQIVQFGLDHFLGSKVVVQRPLLCLGQVDVIGGMLRLHGLARWRLRQLFGGKLAHQFMQGKTTGTDGVDERFVQ